VSTPASSAIRERRTAADRDRIAVDHLRGARGEGIEMGVGVERSGQCVAVRRVD
jgi:hypothetical protein